MSTLRSSDLVGLAIVLAVALTCGSAPAQQRAAPDDGTDPGRPDTQQPSDAQQPASAPDGQALLDEASSIAHQVADIRGLEMEHEIDKGLRNRDQLRRVLITQLANEVTDKDIANEAKVFKKLGLMDPDLDYKQTLLDVLTEQIAGFYDQNAKELYIMEGIPLQLQRPAMAHEIFHAIQDQHFDIKRMVEPISSKSNGDFSLARSALIEGDASVVMIDFSLYEDGVLPRQGVRSVVDIPMMANLLTQISHKDVGALQEMVPDSGAAAGSPIDPSQLSQSALADAPRMVRKLLVFPYFGGMRFVISARTGRGADTINKVYRRGPVSTEQILHPDRYFDDDQPVGLSYETDGVLDADHLIYDSVFGEYQMRLVLEQHLLDGDHPAAAQQQIDRAMTGWDGDRIQAYATDDDTTVLAHLSAWDTLDDADQYFDTLVDMMGVRFPDAQQRRQHGAHGQSLCLWVGGDGPHAERIYLEKWGDLVLHLEGLPTKRDADGNETDPTAVMLRQRIMGSVERTPFQKIYRQKMHAYDAEHADAEHADADTNTDQ